MTPNRFLETYSSAFGVVSFGYSLARISAIPDVNKSLIVLEHQARSVVKTEKGRIDVSGEYDTLIVIK